MEVFMAIVLNLFQFAFWTGCVAQTSGIYMLKIVSPVGPRYFASLGSNLTITCALYGPQTDQFYVLKWSFSDKTGSRCNGVRAGQLGSPLAGNTCNYLAGVVDLSSEGNYRCYSPEFTGFSPVPDSVDVYILELLLASTVELRDFSSGESLDLHTGPTCVESGREQTFECAVRDTKPGIWNLTWIIGNIKGEEAVERTVPETNTAHESVDVMSIITPQLLGEDGVLINVTCWATVSHHVSLQATAQFKICPAQVPNTTMHLQDLFTGDYYDVHSERICVQSGTTRVFECTVRPVITGTWNITWITDGTVVDTSFEETNGSIAGGLVNLTAKFTLEVPRDGELLLRHLTCKATACDDTPLSIRIELRLCNGKFSNPSIDLMDLTTRDLIESNSSLTCTQQGTRRSFLCTVRDVEPGAWNVTWIVDGTEIVETNSTLLPLRTSGLVIMSSTVDIATPQNDEATLSLACYATSLMKESLIIAVLLQACPSEVIRGTMDLVDLSTGIEVGGNLQPDCIQAGTERTFECTVRSAKPGIWNLTWLLEGSRKEIPPTEVTPSKGELVNISSRFPITGWWEEIHEKKLTCIATGLNIKTGPLNVTVTLQSCSGVVVELVDLWTGKPVHDSSDPVCVKVGTEQTFECRVRPVSRDDRKIVWILDDSKVENRTVVETPMDKGLFQLASRFTVLHREDSALPKSLACEVMGPDKKTIHVDVQLYCSGEPLANSSTTILVVVIAVVGAVLLICVVAFVVFAAMTVRRSRKMQMTPGTEEVVEHNPEPEAVTVSEDIINYENTITAFPPSKGKDTGLPCWAERWEIQWSDLTVETRVLGSGNFGEVRAGSVRIDGEVSRAAIKMLKGQVSRVDREDFMDELWTMTSIGYHPNIVMLLGACEHQDVLYVALEYLPHGDLRSYLRTARSQSDSDEDALSSDQLLKFALDVACGMDHLSLAGVIHRDLAARNILLGDGLIAKVSDFGLSRGEDIYVQTSRRRVPLRWLAIESVRDHLYTTQSDVWSFGILLWEIATFGGTPYPSIQNELLTATLKRGYRMPKPDNCHDEIYGLMRNCWEENPNDRPTFNELVSILSDMSDNTIKHTYMAPIRTEYQNMSIIRPELDEN
ncbi:uncharacterized protein LOC110975479 [Acanthaster planci]|uniref:receptor protein-tyrosine kinase n=1 Tax=Acanthaster planci TaxID=133434 RepID=A0A8B7XUL4_ACAPL|nr:uncharacterized protein LOC110975479 [Acanthaster planci]